jgi:hypothetical protein
MKISLIIALFIVLSCNNQHQDAANTGEKGIRSDAVASSSPLTSMSIIAIEGNHSNERSLIFKFLGYAEFKKDQAFSSLDSCAAFLHENYFDYANKNIALRGFWEYNGWTIILDPEMVDMAEDTALTMISGKLNSQVLTFLIEKTSGSYAFVKYSPSKIRSYFSADGKITENLGPPLGEENGFNFSQYISGDDILKLAGKFGIEFEAARPSFVVKELHYEKTSNP